MNIQRKQKTPKSTETKNPSKAVNPPRIPTKSTRNSGDNVAKRLGIPKENHK